LVIEKPFGVDLASARELNAQLEPLFPEDTVYRIDHYLGKEAVQNLFVLRFANAIFEPLWNRHYVDHVQLTVAESIGVGTRGGYYDTTGATRDILQNHGLQVLSLVAMEPPSSFDATSIRDEKVKVLRAIPPVDGSDLREAVRARYGPGWSGAERVVGYLQEADVPADSITETYAALRLEVDNARWSGVPFFLRTGKRLPQRVTELTVQFSGVPHMPFPDRVRSAAEGNSLVLRIQPDEGASLRFLSKVPGPRLDVRPVGMDFAYGNTFLRESPSAYERLLLDCLLGDTTLFARWDEVERAWEIVDPLLREWSSGGPLAEYEAGAWGPGEADTLLGQGRKWRPG
jgi:glucose-6-phosphate 1-dehydrogenase